MAIGLAVFLLARGSAAQPAAEQVAESVAAPFEVPATDIAGAEARIAPLAETSGVEARATDATALDAASLPAELPAESATPDIAPNIEAEIESGAAEGAPAASTIWEAQIRDKMRLDIEARERRAWEEAERENAIQAAQRKRLRELREAEAFAAPRATAPQLEARDVVAGRAYPRNDFSPLASIEDRTRRRAEREGNGVLALELASWSYLYGGLGLRDAALATGRLGVEYLPSEARAWLQLARLEIDAGERAAARTAVDQASQLGAPPLDLLALLSPSTPAANSAAAPPPSVRSETAQIASSARSLAADASERVGSAWTAARAFAQRADLQHYGLLALVGALGLALLLRVMRRRGDLMVQIIYPTELRGTFRVRLDSQRRRWKRRMQHSEADIVRGGASSATQHFLVTRETPFRRLACRKYFVTVDGVLQDPRSGEVIERPFLQTTVNVRHRRTVRLDIDATPETCPVDISVVWDGGPVRSAVVAARGHGARPVEADSGHARLQLPHGNYIIVAGSGDRVAERELQVRSYLPTSVEIDLAVNEGIAFKACPPAVEPYLNGHFDSAASALTRDGQADAAHRLLARRAREEGNHPEAALHFEAANEFVEAAELHSTLRNYAHAGELFRRANDPISAAEMYELAGDPVRAGRAFEDARDFESAIACYREAGDAASWVEALERRGDVFEAARTALENGLQTRSIRLLQRVSPDDPNYREACVLLADTFERERHFDIAARKLGDYINASKPDEVEPDIFARLADLHEKSGDLEAALDVLESLRLLDPTFPNLATRTEHLRKARSAKRHLIGGPPSLGDAGPPTVLLAEERYEVLEEIGRGGMGVVSRARDRRLGRIVALKRLSENLQDQPRAVELFLREARAAAALNHSNIVTVYDADQEEGTLFITMELLDGTPLQQLLRRRGRLPSAEIARIGRQVCAGLAYAHERGVIHRDIKTANLFVGSDQRVKIMDFGLAKVVEEVRRGHSLVGGTPYYMAPEQTLGGDVDHRVDLYSLGVTLFELATGRVPFPDGDAAHHNRHSLPPNPLDLAPGIDARLVELILHLLEKDPDRRSQNATAVGRRLAVLDPSPPQPSAWDGAGHSAHE